MLTRPDPGTLVFRFDGAEVHARPGDTIAVALLAAGIVTTRTTPVGDRPRGPFCMMGACFDCLAVVDGVGGVQTCLTEAREGMQVETQYGARTLDD